MITDKFIFFHLPKCGGTTQQDYVKELRRRGLLKLMGNVGESSARPWVKDTRFKWGLVRNPWMWYTSRYRWFWWRKFRNDEPKGGAQMDKGLDNPIWQAASEKEAPKFKEYMLWGFERDKSMGMKEIYANHEEDREPFIIDGKYPKVRFFAVTALYRDMLCNRHGDEIVDYVGRLEDVDSDGDKPYRLAGVDLDGMYHPSKQKRSKILRYGDYKDFYDDELRELVADVDADFIKKFDYKFGDPDPMALWRKV